MVDMIRERKISLMDQFQKHDIGITVFLNCMNDIEKFRKNMKID